MQTNLKHYKKIRVIGEGGYGIVWEAEEVGSGRRVAIKEVREDRKSERLIALFKHEITHLFELDHPHIVQLLFGDLNNLALVMEFMPGKSLRHRLNDKQRYPRQQMPEREVLEIARQLLHALDYIHREKHIVHRDLKPSNILLDASGRLVKLSDFGILWKTDYDGAGVAERGGMGSGDYESPEQLLGNRDLDGRSDLYSLGVVLYELLTGERPFTHCRTKEEKEARAHALPPDIRLRRPDLSKQILALVNTALAPHPDSRFDHAKHMLLVVEKALKASPRAAVTPSRFLARLGQQPLARFARRGLQVVLGAAGLVAVLVGVGLGGNQLGPLAKVGALASLPAAQAVAPPPTETATRTNGAAATQAPIPVAVAPILELAATPTLRPPPTAVPSATPVPPTATPQPTALPTVDAQATAKRAKQTAVAARPRPTRIRIIATATPPPAPPAPAVANQPQAPAIALSTRRGSCPFMGGVEWVGSAPNGYFCSLWSGKPGEGFSVKWRSLPNFGYACLDAGSGFSGAYPNPFDHVYGALHQPLRVRLRVWAHGNVASCEQAGWAYEEFVDLRMDFGAYTR